MVSHNKKGKALKATKSNRWAWLDDATIHGNQGFTFPQVKPSLLKYETPQSLDGKIPMVPGSTDFVTLYTTKLGTKRFLVPPDAEFDLSDPYYGPSLGYNFLHDPHLDDYLSNPEVKKRLTKQGLITESNRVKCTIKEFNDYRQWIRKLKLDALDQEWHLQQASLSKETKSRNLNELSKQRQQRAKTLYQQKEKKRELARAKYVKMAEEKQMRIEAMKKQFNDKYRERKKTNNTERKKKMVRINETEMEGKKIRLKILLDGKESDKKRKMRIQEQQEQKLTEKEQRAINLWRRRQGYSLEQMNELMEKKVTEKDERELHIKRRESVYHKERRKSIAYMMQCSAENRENALKHRQEADEFIERIESKKCVEVEKWKRRLKNMKARQEILDYCRQKRKGRNDIRRKDKRYSVWDVDEITVEQLLERFTQDERDELSIICQEHSLPNSPSKMDVLTEVEEEDFQSPRDELRDHLEEDTELTQIDSEKKPADSVPRHLDISVRGDGPSIITFGNINADDVFHAYHERRRMSLQPTQQQEGRLEILEIPGLMIEHTKSEHYHAPCIFDNEKSSTSESESEEEEIVAIEVLDEENNSATKFFKSEAEVSQSRKVLDELSTSEIVKQKNKEEVSSKASTEKIESEPSDAELLAQFSLINGVSKALVQTSLAEAARSMGYAAEDIYRQLGIRFDADETHDAGSKYELLSKKSSTASSENLGEILSSIPQTASSTIILYAKVAVELSLVGAAISLGYRGDQITEALGDDRHHNNLSEIVEEYNRCIRDVTNEAVFKAALSLGYNESQANLAIHHLVPSSSESPSVCSLDDLQKEREHPSQKIHSSISRTSSDTLHSTTSSVTKIGRWLANTAIEDASQKLGIKCEPKDIKDISRTSSDTLHSTTSSATKIGRWLAKTAIEEAARKLGIKCELDIGERLSTNSIESKTRNAQQHRAPVLAHNALRCAALSLGYPSTEVDKKIGPEKIFPYDCSTSESLQSLLRHDSLGQKSTMESVAVWAENASKISFTGNDRDINIRYTYPWDISTDKDVDNKMVDRKSSEVIKAAKDESAKLVTEAIQKAIQNAFVGLGPIDSESSVSGIDKQESIESGDTKGTECTNEETIKLKGIAQNLVKKVMNKSLFTMKKEKQRQARSDEKILKSVAMKLSLLIIGSVGRACGHDDVGIIQAFDRDRLERFNRLQETPAVVEEKPELLLPQQGVDGTRRGSMLKGSPNWQPKSNPAPTSVNVLFDELSINVARRISLDMPEGNRPLIKSRPLTPVPSFSYENVKRDSDYDKKSSAIELAEKLMKEDSLVKSCEVPDDDVRVASEDKPSKRKRKVTPYNPEAPRLISDFQVQEGDILEEEEDIEATDPSEIASDQEVPELTQELKFTLKTRRDTPVYLAPVECVRTESARIEEEDEDEDEEEDEQEEVRNDDNKEVVEKEMGKRKKKVSMAQNTLKDKQGYDMTKEDSQMLAEKPVIKERRKTPFYTESFQTAVINEFSGTADGDGDGNISGSGANFDNGSQIDSHKSSVKCRRKTPFYTPSFQQEVIQEFSKNNADKEDGFPRVDDDSDGDSCETDIAQFRPMSLSKEKRLEEYNVNSNEQFANLCQAMDQKWSKEFLQKLDKYTEDWVENEGEIDAGFSTGTEVDMLTQIQRQIEEDRAVLEKVSEYPTETEFLNQLNEVPVSPLFRTSKMKLTSKPKFANVLQKDELSPELLLLYNSIQDDIRKLLDSVDWRHRMQNKHLTLMIDNDTCRQKINLFPEIDKSSCISLTKSTSSNSSFHSNNSKNAAERISIEQVTLPRITSQSSLSDIGRPTSTSSNKSLSISRRSSSSSSSVAQKLPPINYSPTMFPSDANTTSSSDNFQNSSSESDILEVFFRHSSLDTTGFKKEEKVAPLVKNNQDTNKSRPLSNGSQNDVSRKSPVLRKSSIALRKSESGSKMIRNKASDIHNSSHSKKSSVSLNQTSSKTDFKDAEQRSSSPTVIRRLSNHSPAEKSTIVKSTISSKSLSETALSITSRLYDPDKIKSQAKLDEPDVNLPISPTGSSKSLSSTAHSITSRLYDAEKIKSQSKLEGVDGNRSLNPTVSGSINAKSLSGTARSVTSRLYDVEKIKSQSKLVELDVLNQTSSGSINAKSITKPKRSQVNNIISDHALSRVSLNMIELSMNSSTDFALNSSRNQLHLNKDAMSNERTNLSKQESVEGMETSFDKVKEKYIQHMAHVEIQEKPIVGIRESKKRVSLVQIEGINNLENDSSSVEDMEVTVDKEKESYIRHIDSVDRKQSLNKTAYKKSLSRSKLRRSSKGSSILITGTSVHRRSSYHSLRSDVNVLKSDSHKNTLYEDKDKVKDAKDTELKKSLSSQSTGEMTYNDIMRYGQDSEEEIVLNSEIEHFVRSTANETGRSHHYCERVVEEKKSDFSDQSGQSKTSRGTMSPQGNRSNQDNRSSRGTISNQGNKSSPGSSRGNISNISIQETAQVRSSGGLSRGRTSQDLETIESQADIMFENIGPQGREFKQISLSDSINALKVASPTPNIEGRENEILIRPFTSEQAFKTDNYYSQEAVPFQSGSLNQHVPTPPLSKRSSNIMCSRSLSFIKNRSKRAVMRSKSMGSARVLSGSKLVTDTFRETVPMIGEGETMDFNDIGYGSPMPNNVRSVKSGCPSMSNTTWNPLNSIVGSSDVAANAVVVQPKSASVSRNVSTSSFHSTHSTAAGPIVVAEAESVTFGDTTSQYSDPQVAVEAVEKLISVDDPKDID